MINEKTNSDRDILKSLLVLGSVVEARDAYTGGHIWRVSQFGELIGRKAGLTGNDLYLVLLGGFLHDLGKVGIPDGVLMKQGPLDDAEYAIIKTHPAIGLDIIKHHPLGHLVEDVVTHHHEWMNGGGYPEGITDRQVTLGARIIGLADAFDAMTSTRPYRKDMPIEKTLSIIQGSSGDQFDPSLVDTLQTLYKEDCLQCIVGHSGEGCRLAECAQCGPVIVVPKSTKSGDEVVCKVCSGKFCLEKDGENFGAAFTGEHATQNEMRAEPDFDPINEILAKVPDGLRF